jgi:mono/diheme cytochrome c family protein
VSAPVRGRWCRTALLAAALAPVGCGGTSGGTAALASGLAAPAGSRAAAIEQVLLGRQLVVSHDCGACHGGGGPERMGWLAGNPAEAGAFVLDGYRAWSRNLTPDPDTGTGGYTDRQLFNALRYGLRPASTPDVEVTSASPGEGNHPVRPDYLSPMMPWTSWRHMSDEELHAIIAYLRHLRPVRNEIPDPIGPSDGWMSWFTPDLIGPHPVAPFPTVNEALADGADLDRVLRGRKLVTSMGCGDCHGGRGNPAAPGWLAGVVGEGNRPRQLPYELGLAVGPYMTYPRNLTPDNATGLGRFSERQIFNALRYGLRPGETADVEITSTVPGEGNFPRHPKYLPPSMPWTAWRHLSDEEIRSIIAYLKHGLQPVRNRPPDSGGPPDFWVGVFRGEAIGAYPAAPFPTRNERPAS